MLNDMMDKGKEAAAKILYNENWSRVFDRSGNPAGVRFECPRCHLIIPFHAPAEVFHCGAVEKRPSLVPSGEVQKAEESYRVRWI